MKTTILALLALTIVACGSVGVIESKNVTGTTTTLTERLDAYVAGDTTINEDQKTNRLGRSASVREYFASGEPVPVRPIYTDLILVLDWHDAYISSDEALSEFERRLAEFESNALRGAATEAMKRVE